MTLRVVYFPVNEGDLGLDAEYLAIIAGGLSDAEN